MDKKALRLEIKKRILALSDPEKEWASGAICDMLSELDEFKHSYKIFCYLGSKTEPDTEGIIGLSLGMEKLICVPKVRGDEMDAISISPFTNFKTNKWDILEPEKGQKLEPDEFDLIICPLVGFNGVDRLGHGKGYYDKYLEKTKAIKIGLAFDTQEVKDLKVEPHDIPLDMIITEKRIITSDSVIKNKYYGE